MELLLDFIDGGDPPETLESAGYCVQNELVGILDMTLSRTTVCKHDEVHGLSPYHCHRGLTTPNLATPR
jgi:hypothetical protein